MAFQMIQLAPPAHFSGLPFPALANPANPPTQQDVFDGMRYSRDISVENALNPAVAPMSIVVEAKRYEHAVVAAYDLAQIPVPAPLPAGAAPPPLVPLGGQALAALLAGQAQMTATLAQIQGTLASIQATLGSLSRMSTIEFNRLRGGGNFAVVPFLDDTLPTVAIPAGGALPPRAALPHITDIAVLRGMGGADLSAYMRGYYGAATVIPNALDARRVRIADAIGCTTVP
ncbi:hypothetical protein BDZ89DRAFT_1118192 [Hymenopellis radicata]|nr:hypothetical protein BDZ89DRAFT_1118192 [Hymenopellis radicata]